MFNDRFCAECLSGEEAAFLREHVVPTYPYGTCCHLWDDARSHKEHYVLKHARLGKSEKVYAGRLCSDRLWSELFERPELHDMVLQPFVEQRRWRVR